MRARLSAAQRARGSRGNEHDTRAIALELVKLRAQRAQLLGFPNHAAVVTADNVAKTPEAVRGDADPASPQPAAKPTRSARAGQARGGVAGEPRLALADWPFYAEQVRSGRLRHRPGGAAALLRGRAGASRRGVFQRHPAVRTQLHRASGPARLSPRRPRLRGLRGRRLTGRSLPPGPLHARVQGRRGVDELPGQRGQPHRDGDRGGGQQPQRAQARRAGQPTLLTYRGD